MPSSSSGMSGTTKLVLVLLIAVAGFAGWKFYKGNFGSKNDSELFAMVAEGGAKASGAEGELMLRLSTGKTDPSVFRARLRDSSPKVRALACRGVKSKKDKEATDALLGILADSKEDAEVKAAACSAFVDIRVKEAIPPLIEHLSYNSDAVRQAASEALRSITGEKYSNKEVDGWKNWWDSNKATFKVKE